MMRSVALLAMTLLASATVVSVKASPPHVVWNTTIGATDASSAPGGTYAFTTHDHDRYYVTDAQSVIYALYITNGSIAWQYAGYQIGSITTVPNAGVLLIHEDPNVVGVDARSGQLLWTIPNVAGGPFVPVGPEGTDILFNNFWEDNNTMIRFNAKTGQIKYTLNNYDTSPVLVPPENRIAMSMGSNIFSALNMTGFDVDTGAVVWSTGNVYGDVLGVTAKGLVAVMNADASHFQHDSLSVIHGATGAIVYDYVPGAARIAASQAPILDGDLLCQVTHSPADEPPITQSMECVDVAKGKLAWTTNMTAFFETYGTGLPCYAAGNLIFAYNLDGSTNGGAVAYSMQNEGRVAWNVSSGVPVMPNPGFFFTCVNPTRADGRPPKHHGVLAVEGQTGVTVYDGKTGKALTYLDTDSGLPDARIQSIRLVESSQGTLTLILTSGSSVTAVSM